MGMRGSPHSGSSRRRPWRFSPMPRRARAEHRRTRGRPAATTTRGGHTMTIAEKRADAAASGADAEIRPFSYTATDEELDDLRRRIRATRWPDRETVDDTS